MALEVTITNINSVTYPVDVYVCEDCLDTNCTLVDTINSVPANITIPGPYSGLTSFGVKIIDDVNCQYCQTFTNTTTTTTTLNPLCISCDIGFDFYDTNPIGEISVGSVTASCDTTITDYVINWYGPGVGSTTLAFTSGLGSTYSADYTYTHPLTGTSSIPVVAGIYTPIIEKIIINTIEYSDLNCFGSTTVNVDALTCDNGTGTDTPQYSHGLSFSATTNLTPPSVYSTFVLDPTKPYVAYRFAPEQIFDTLKITFYGSNYSDPIVVEYISAGFDLNTTDLNYNVLPKKLKTTQPANFYFSKVLTLTQFTINSGDYLEFEITPNQNNNNTNWKFYCECLETFNCDLCYDTNNNPPFKIIESSIIQTTPNSCDQIDIEYDISGCTDSDIYRYMGTNGTWFGTTYAMNLYLGTTNVSCINMSSTPNILCIQQGNIMQYPCETPKSSTITFNKSVPTTEGQINMTFTDITDLEAYYYGWLNLFTNYSGNTTDCTDINYYRYFLLRIPNTTGSEICGDNSGILEYLIHPSSIVTTGGTGPWTMTIDMNTITDCISFTNCDSFCNSIVEQIVLGININSTGTTNNISLTTNTGSRYTSPWAGYNALESNTQINSACTSVLFVAIPKYINETIPYSGNPLTIIPSLTAETCNFDDWTFSTFWPATNGNFYVYYGSYYEIRRPNPLDVTDFEIWTTLFTNGVYSGYPGFANTMFKIYEYVGGVPNVIDPSYFI